MRRRPNRTILVSATLAGVAALAGAALAHDSGRKHERHSQPSANVQVGPRPFYLVNDMDEGAL